MLTLGPIRQPGSPPIKQYGDLWGIRNYAMTRLLNPEQMKSILKKMDWTSEVAPLFLELRHGPNLNTIKLGKDQWGRLRPRIGLSYSYIPLKEKELRELFSRLYTARFVIKNGFAMRYTAGETSPNNTHFLPRMKDVPDGTYEFYEGIGYQVKWGGVIQRLPSTHPLMQFSLHNLQLLFNLGIHFDTRAASEQGGDWLGTERFAYFREGTLHVMGVPLLYPNDPTLADFLLREEKKQAAASIQNPYTPFIDQNPPSFETIKEYGLVVPEKTYLVLGDNFAMSADSRDFGFVPEGNLRGAPAFIFWPFGSRIGAPNQPSAPWTTLPNFLIWGFACLAAVAWGIYQKQKYKLPLQFK
jgi:signal peptidase I